MKIMCSTHSKIEMKQSIEADTIFLYCPACEPEIERETSQSVQKVQENKRNE